MIEQAIYAIGVAHPGMAALIVARLYPVAEESRHPTPCVVYGKGEERPVAGIYQNSGWQYTAITFAARGASALECKQVIAQVRAAYERYHGASSGHSIDDVLATGDIDEYFDDELGCYVEEVELEFFHN